MKALSLWQPWATLMALELKTIETRSWSTSYRGSLVICAAKCWNKDQEAFFNQEWILIALGEYGIASKSDLPFGAALCEVDLIDVLPTEEIVQEISTPEIFYGNYDDGRFGWVTTFTRKFDAPIPIKGKQGLWEWNYPTPVAIFNQ